MIVVIHSVVSMLRKPLLAAAVAGALLLGLAACGDDTAGGRDKDGRITVTAAFYPLQFLAERVGGDRVAVTNLTKAGVEPHDLELNRDQVAAVHDAGLVLYLAGFQPEIGRAHV